MKIKLLLGLGLFKLAYGISTSINVGYIVPVSCSIENLVSSVQINQIANEIGIVNTNFTISCNDNTPIYLTLNSSNQDGNTARMFEPLRQNYLSYNVLVNGINYLMNTPQKINPNTLNILTIETEKAKHIGNFSDNLTLTINY